MTIVDYFARMERKKLYLFGGIGLVSLIIIIIIIVVATRPSSGEIRGSDALLNVPLIDGHNDVPNNLREILKNEIKDFNFDKNLTDDSVWGKDKCKYCFTDIPRMRQGRLGAQFWVAYVYCSTQYKDAVAQTVEQIDVIKRLVKKYPNDMMIATSADEIVTAFENKKIASLIAVEGGHSIDSRLGVLRIYYELGVRYMTLTHTCDTPWADASPTDPPNHNLTEFGKKIVLEMNRLGMMVDLSHVSANVMREAINVSKAPVIFSHSNAYSIYNHHRNVPDDVLEKLKANGGIIMVNFYTGFVAKENVTMYSVMEHINYIAKKIGPDHIGIGADFDGVDSTAVGLEDVSKYPALFDALYKNNSQTWSIPNLEKLAGRNLLRVLKQVEAVRDKMAKDPVIEDWIPKEDIQVIPETPENLTVCRTERDVAGRDHDIFSMIDAKTNLNDTTLTSETETSLGP